MIRQILALGGIRMGITCAQTAGAQSTNPGTTKGYQPIAPAPGWTAPMTPWGEPDLQGTWPINHLIGVPLERNRQYGNRLYLTDEEVAKAEASLEARNKRFESGPIPQADTSRRAM